MDIYAMVSLPAPHGVRRTLTLVVGDPASPFGQSSLHLQFFCLLSCFNTDFRRAKLANKSTSLSNDQDPQTPMAGSFPNIADGRTELKCYAKWRFEMRLRETKTHSSFEGVNPTGPMTFAEPQQATFSAAMQVDHRSC